MSDIVKSHRNLELKTNKFKQKISQLATDINKYGQGHGGAGERKRLETQLTSLLQEADAVKRSSMTTLTLRSNRAPLPKNTSLVSLIQELKNLKRRMIQNTDPELKKMKENQEKLKKVSNLKNYYTNATSNTNLEGLQNENYEFMKKLKNIRNLSNKLNINVTKYKNAKNNNAKLIAKTGFNKTWKTILDKQVSIFREFNDKLSKLLESLDQKQKNKFYALIKREKGIKLDNKRKFTNVPIAKMDYIILLAEDFIHQSAIHKTQEQAHKNITKLKAQRKKIKKSQNFGNQISKFDSLYIKHVDPTGKTDTTISMPALNSAGAIMADAGPAALRGAANGTPVVIYPYVAAELVEDAAQQEGTSTGSQPIIIDGAAPISLNTMKQFANLYNSNTFKEYKTYWNARTRNDPTNLDTFHKMFKQRHRGTGDRTRAQLTANVASIERQLEHDRTRIGPAPPLRRGTRTRRPTIKASAAVRAAVQEIPDNIAYFISVLLNRFEPAREAREGDAKPKPHSFNIKKSSNGSAERKRYYSILNALKNSNNWLTSDDALKNTLKNTLNFPANTTEHTRTRILDTSFALAKNIKNQKFSPHDSETKNKLKDALHRHYNLPKSTATRFAKIFLGTNPHERNKNYRPTGRSR